VELRQLKPTVTVRPASFDWRLALQLHAKLDKERSSSLKVVDNDADVVHPVNRHIPRHKKAARPDGRYGHTGRAIIFYRMKCLVFDISSLQNGRYRALVLSALHR
jgi:hypothetical protein